jgi:hypothetical protein
MHSITCIFFFFFSALNQSTDLVQSPYLRRTSEPRGRSDCRPYFLGNLFYIARPLSKVHLANSQVRGGGRGMFQPSPVKKQPLHTGIKCMLRILNFLGHIIQI